ncbi:tRNA (adenosine(37)-N6)-threonylcarbamoyltransferase complex dimerization subunit type 1 TsaB [Hydrogenovibrio halophilus]|uniref:tRNA (adenosine(37)-N6)-threonylcarbamoyltransferase complex dimerization subunit type 1 TsaB n=1 Tax=Hydrogenovibrio halophilus TaxID=373391 RepID=UPI00037EF50B|nr:tRNA (adenosine(37)-N6)-threonylcarbamoyltransferase complex dimerization subunit type 1 TsaB [Hydrogenovibrio halophilus]
MSPTILAIETSTKACSAALLTQGETFEVFELAPQKHADRILPMVMEVLAQGGCSAQDLDCLAYANGPGAFTGVRIAAGVIQGLGFGWQKPVIGVSTLEALIHQAWSKRPDLADQTWVGCLDARMQEVYWQSGHRSQTGQLVSQPAEMLGLEAASARVADQAATEQTLGIGDLVWALPEWEDAFSVFVPAYPRAGDVAAVAAQRLDQARLVTESLPQPIYLRNQVTS